MHGAISLPKRLWTLATKFMVVTLVVRKIARVDKEGFDPGSKMYYLSRSGFFPCYLLLREFFL